MKISIIGAGALGCLHGVYLAESGQEVTLTDIRTDIVESIKRDGLRLDGVRGEHRVTVDAATPDTASGASDVVIVVTHTNGTPAAAQLAANLLTDDGCAITLQNGIGNVEALVDAIGPERVLGGISYNSATFNGPGYTTHTNAGPTWIGDLDGQRTGRVDDLYRILEQAGLEVRVSDNINGVIWKKFVQSCAIHAICALSGLMAGEIAAVPEADALQDRALREALAVVKAKGITLADDDPVASIKRMSSTVFVQPSMLQHVEQGRATEIDSQNGALVREGRALGIDTPYNEALTLMIKAREAHAASTLPQTP